MNTLYNKKVDWISFSVKMEGINDGRGVESYVDALVDRHLRHYGTWWGHFVTGADWEQGKGRAPYSMSQIMVRRGVTCFYNPALPHCLWEISGVGCNYLREIGLLEQTLSTFQSDLTRLDIAVDFETDMEPKEFAMAGWNPRIKSHSYQESSSGKTQYIGSRKSEKFCRVYKYNPPHERSHLLRVEFQLKKKQARPIAQVILGYGLDEAVATVSDSFAFKEKMWELASSDVISFPDDDFDKSSSNTMFWLMTQVKPAINRLIESGAIADPEEWFRKSILDIHEGGR